MDGQCRLCLNEKYDMINICDVKIKTVSEFSLIGSIYMFYGIKITMKDQLTKLICQNCFNIIEYIQVYRQKYKKNQLKLLKTRHMQDPSKKHSPTLKLDADLFIEKTVDQDGEISNPITEKPKNIIAVETTKLATSLMDKSLFLETALQLEPQKNGIKRKDLKDGTYEHLQSEKDYIKVPMDVFENELYPLVQINSLEKRIADDVLYNKTKVVRIRKISKIKKKYLKHYYNRTSIGAIRELIQEKARKELYLSVCDHDNTLKSVYEYDFNLDKSRKYDRSLWRVDMQCSVFVCSYCNKVYYNKGALEAHKKIHRQFEEILQIRSVIF